MSGFRTCFKRVDYDLVGLLHYIDIGDIGLPDKAGKAPVFVKVANLEKFFVRAGASMMELSACQSQDYIKQRYV